METNTTTQTPTIGTGVTICFYSDREAGTIIAVSKNGKRITVQEDDAVRTDNYGMSDKQTYAYTANTENKTYEFSLRKDGYFYEVGSPIYVGTSCHIGSRKKYYDFSF